MKDYASADFGVCYKFDENERSANHWSYGLSAFGVKDIWEYGRPDGYPYEYRQKPEPILIRDASSLPRERPLIVVAPKHGVYIKGDISLTFFAHPEDAIYLFGNDKTHLTEEDLGGRRDYLSVYIPTDTIDLYSAQAGAIVFYDRLVKRNGEPDNRQQN